MIGRAASVVIGVVMTAAAVWLLITPETLAELRAALVNADWRALVAAIALSVAVQWLRAWRFAVMTSGTAKLPDSRLVGIALQLNFFNFVLPFRLGELSYPVLMRRAYRQPLMAAAGVLIVARLLDLCTVAAVLLMTAAWLGVPYSRSAAFLGILGAALAVTPIVLAATSLPARSLSLPAGLAAGLAALRSRPARLLAVALSFAGWLTFGGLAILASDAVLKNFPPATAMLGAAASNVAFALPINGIAGLGPAQAAWVLAVTQAGVGWDDAVVSALAVYAVTLSSALLFGGLAIALSNPAERRPMAAGHEDRPTHMDKPLV